MKKTFRLSRIFQRDASLKSQKSAFRIETNLLLKIFATQKQQETSTPVVFSGFGRSIQSIADDIYNAETTRNHHSGHFWFWQINSIYC